MPHYYYRQCSFSPLERLKIRPDAVKATTMEAWCLECHWMASISRTHHSNPDLEWSGQWWTRTPGGVHMRAAFLTRKSSSIWQLLCFDFFLVCISHYSVRRGNIVKLGCDCSPPKWWDPEWADKAWCFLPSLFHLSGAIHWADRTSQAVCFRVHCLDSDKIRLWNVSVIAGAVTRLKILQGNRRFRFPVN